MLAGTADQKQFLENKSALKDMEAAHIARLCTQARKKLLLLKVVSDLIDSEQCPQEQFAQHFSNVMQILAKKLRKLVDVLTNPLAN